VLLKGVGKCSRDRVSAQGIGYMCSRAWICVQKGDMCSKCGMCSRAWVICDQGRGYMCSRDRGSGKCISVQGIGAQGSDMLSHKGPLVTTLGSPVNCSKKFPSGYSW
jgi:hypothetical protein